MFNVADFVKDFHSKHSGLTEDLLSHYLTSSGKTSYEALLDILKEPEGKTVLDLGCGSGPLTQLCSQKVGDNGKVIAVDFSIQELELAKKRVKATNVNFLCEPAHQISISDSSVDVVLCHLALALMQPLEPVIKEIRRILKPNGIFSCIVGGTNHSSPIYNEYCALLNSFLQQNSLQYLEDGLGDTNINSISKLYSIFKEEGLYADPQSEDSDFTLEFKGKKEKVAADVMSFFYASSTLPPKGQQALLSKSFELFEKYKHKDGEIIFLIPQERFTVRKMSPAIINAKGT